MPTAITQQRPADDEIDTTIVSVIVDLARDDADLVRWSKIRARLPQGWGWRRVHEAQHRLWRSGRIVLVQIGGTPLDGLADEVTEFAEAACARRGEPKRVAMV